MYNISVQNPGLRIYSLQVELVAAFNKLLSKNMFIRKFLEIYTLLYLYVYIYIRRKYKLSTQNFYFRSDLKGIGTDTELVL